jgi:hypothetical protein
MEKTVLPYPMRGKGSLSHRESGPGPAHTATYGPERERLREYLPGIKRMEGERPGFCRYEKIVTFLYPIIDKKEYGMRSWLMEKNPI